MNPSPLITALPRTFPAGTVFAGKYCVERLLGRGGMGTVLAARHMDLGHRVAIKVLHQQFATDEVANLRFQREAKACVRLESEHVVQVMDVGSDHGTSYIVMEFLEGQDLASILREQGKVSSEQAVSWLLEACDAIAEAHAQGIVHRDLKPGNLFLCRRRRGSPIIKVLDFGISKALVSSLASHRDLTETHTILGTPHYASPEQLRGNHDFDIRSDIWSMGVLLHRLVSGGRPFDCDTPGGLIAKIAADPPTPVRETAPEVSITLEEIILRCLQKDPANRYQTVAELIEALLPLASPDARRRASTRSRRSIAPPLRLGVRSRPSTLRDLLAAKWDTDTAQHRVNSPGILPIPRWTVILSLSVALALLVFVHYMTTAADVSLPTHSRNVSAESSP